MLNIISFSLWGSGKKYRLGAIENCRLAPIIYPGWKVRIYVDSSVDQNFCRTLQNHGAEVCLVQNIKGSYHGMYWRFLVNDDPSVDRYIIRDLDSRLNWREQAAVEAWISSGLGFHIMRDHKNHEYPIQGGMWGGKTKIIPSINNLIQQWNKYDSYMCDQHFLAKMVYPIIRDNATVHDEYYEKKPFPPHRTIDNGGWFVGQVYDENGIPQKD